MDDDEDQVRQGGNSLGQDLLGGEAAAGETRSKTLPKNLKTLFVFLFIQFLNI